MTSSYGPDIFTQTSQFRPATFQSGPTGPYRNPNPAQPNVVETPPTFRPQAVSRPHSITELADIAKQSLGEDPLPFKTWLRIAENARRDAKTYQEQGDLEGAFLEYAKAATIVLDKIPAHPQYRVLLTATQRHNMGLHGQEILDSLAEIKVTIMSRYEQWRANPSSVQYQSQHPLLSNPNPQASVLRRGIHSHGTNTPSSSSTRSSSRCRASMPPRSRTPSPYNQSPTEGDRPSRGRVDVALRDMPRRREEPYSADGARSEQLYAHEDEMRRRGWEEEGRRQIPEQRPQEQDGILRRQQEAEHAAQAARLGQPAGQNHSVTTAPTAPLSASFSAPASSIQYPSIPAPATSALAPSGPISGYMQMPLETPTRPLPEKTNRTPQRPITTTSVPPPHLGTIQYPSLMTQHQISQGYHPSLGSMFHRPSHSSHPGLLFQTPEPASYNAQFYQNPSKTSQRPHAVYTAGPGTRPPPLPPKELVAPPLGGSDPVARELKTVSFPRDCLNRFTSIASINTARNRETCGLLLGKDKSGRYVVTTLLIPKQHSTSDTCTMDEEELVMQFTEERSLITLGWIHTHPTQSCFMSSVDLHTHSGFQCMLPESFAVVCAPKSTPNFGIFRLTDPPGLQTILECDSKEAFHPHPERPIYTDADKGHVQIKDLPLEIVDLR